MTVLCLIRRRVVASDRSDTVVLVEPVNSASKSDVKVAEHTKVDFFAGELSVNSIGHALSDVVFGSASGSFDIDRAEGSVIAKAGHCPIRVGRLTRGQAELTNAAGGIEVGISEGTAVSVDARSTKGAVRNSLPAQDNPDNNVKVYARTRLDDIVIHRAAA